MNMMTRPNTTRPGIDISTHAQSGRRVIIAAGGTGGHFFPAEALAAELLIRGHNVALLTDRRSGGQTSAVFTGHPVHILKGAGIAGRGIANSIRALFALAAGVLQARAALRQLHPSVIVGFGGYPTVAPALGRRLLRRRIPLVLHEQNAVLGRANRALAGQSAALAVSFANTRAVPRGFATTLTGNPVRPAIAVSTTGAYTPPGDADIRLLITGGSLGARVFSRVVPAALAALPEPLRHRLRVTQQCRAEDLAAVQTTYLNAGIAADLAPFFTNMGALLSGAHLAIARAGASTIAELTLTGRPAILVPLPSAIDDHQTANARSLIDGVWMITESAFNPETLTALLASLLADQEKLTRAAAIMRSHAQPDATSALADLVERAIAGALP